MNSLQTVPQIANLHTDIPAFYANCTPKIKQEGNFILLKVTDSHRWTRTPEGVERDGTELLKAKLSLFPGFKMPTLSGIAGHFTIELTENSDKNALSTFMESQDYILNALPLVNQHCLFAPDKMTLFVLIERVADCIKALDFFPPVSEMAFNKYQVSTHRELCEININFNAQISLPEVYVKIQKLAEDPKFGIVSFQPENLGNICRKRMWHDTVREYKQKHGLEIKAEF